MFGLILSAVLAATVLTPDTILDRVPGTATLKEMVDAVDNDVDARKQDNLPYPTNAIPASVIVDAPWLLTTEAATNYADAVAEKQNVYLRSKSDLTVYLGHFGEWTITRWNETKDMPPEEFRDMSLYALSNIVEVMTDDYGVVTNTGSFEVYYNGGLVCTGTNGPVANATMFHPVITFTLPPPENTRTVSTFVAARLSEVSPTDDRLAKMSDIEGGMSGLVETQTQHTVMLEDHAARIAVMETGKRDLTNNLCVASSFTDWAYEPEPAADYQKLVWMNRSHGYGWYLNGSEEVLITNEENVATLVYEAYGTDFTATRTAICRSNELFVTQSAVKVAADEARVAASNYTDRVASDKADKLLAWTFTGLASRGWVDAKLSFAATTNLMASPSTGATPLKASAPTIGVWTLLTKTSIDSKWVECGSYQGAEDVTFIERFDGAETVSASRETVLYTKAISADNPAFSNAVEKIVEKAGPTEFETWTNGVALAAGRNAQADSLNEWTRTVALGSESSARTDGVTVGGESVAGEKGVSVGLRAGKGYSNRTPGSEAVSLGFESSATNKAVALGTGALATNESSVVIGADAVSHGTGSVTLGKNGTTMDNVFIGSNVVDKLIREEIVYPMIVDATNAVPRIVMGAFEVRADLTAKVADGWTNRWEPSSAVSPWGTRLEDPFWGADAWYCYDRGDDTPYQMEGQQAEDPDATELYFRGGTVTRRVPNVVEKTLATTDALAAKRDLTNISLQDCWMCDGKSFVTSAEANTWVAKDGSVLRCNPAFQQWYLSDDGVNWQGPGGKSVTHLTLSYAPDEEHIYEKTLDRLDTWLAIDSEVSANYVAKEQGKGLSTHDYDDDAVAEVAKVDGKADEFTMWSGVPQGCEILFGESSGVKYWILFDGQHYESVVSEGGKLEEVVVVFPDHGVTVTRTRVLRTGEAVTTQELTNAISADNSAFSNAVNAAIAPLYGQTYDFSTTQGFYMAVQDLVEKLGGKVINPYSP